MIIIYTGDTPKTGGDKLKKISYKIIIAILACSVVATLVMAVAATVRSNRLTRAEAEQLLMDRADLTARDLDLIMNKTEGITDGLCTLVMTTFNPHQARQNPSYIDDYCRQYAPVFRATGEKMPGTKAVYMFFDPGFTGRGKVISYGDKNQSMPEPAQSTYSGTPQSRLLAFP